MRTNGEEGKTFPEADLARAACAGDATAFGELFHRHYAAVHRTVWGMLASEAEAHDVAQEAWIKAWQRRERYNFQSTFSTWVHRIAINSALDALRKRKRFRHRFARLFGGGSHSPVADPVNAPRLNPDEVLENKELGRTIEAALADLPEDQRTVLVLREYEGYSYEEIARLVRCNPGTVMSRLHLARTKIQARLKRELS